MTDDMTYRHIIARTIEDVIERATDHGRDCWTDDYDDMVSELLSKIADAIDSIPEVRMVLERPVPENMALAYKRAKAIELIDRVIADGKAERDGKGNIRFKD